jgi:hypothetical protein
VEHDHLARAVRREQSPRAELYVKSQTRWLVHTVNCGTLAITVGNPGYPYSGGQRLAEQLSTAGTYRLTLHGWGDRRDIVSAAPANPAARPSVAVTP